MSSDPFVTPVVREIRPPPPTQPCDHKPAANPRLNGWCVKCGRPFSTNQPEVSPQ